MSDCRRKTRRPRGRAAYDARVRGLLLGLIWITACYAPSVPSNVRCSPSGECPDGQSCIAGFCTTGGTLTPDMMVVGMDKDHDGIADDKDNCPDVANNSATDMQFNEDGDKFGDACDKCPQLVDNTNADTDGDGIGDACDPRPTIPDAIALYEGFHAGLPAAWGKSSHWTYMADSVQATSTGNTGDDGEYLDTPFVSKLNPPDNFTISATVTIVATVTNNSGDHSAGVEAFDAKALNNNGAGVRCGLEHFDGQGPTLFLVDDLSNPNLEKTATYNWAFNTQYRITLARQGSLYTCTVYGPNGAADKASVNGNSTVTPRNSDDSVDIWAFGTTSQFGSVEIFGPQ